MECEHRLTGKRVQACLAAIGRVTVDDTALNRFIQSGDQSANLLSVRLIRPANLFLKRAKPRPHGAILTGTGKRLSGTFGS